MGVHNLWQLLTPVGRRVSVETLTGKRLAIDASIWMVQFMKAMRDEKGEMVRNAHLLGFFRRICKLLFLRTKPVFVFDGGTPALKRRTVIARRRHRENAQAKVRKTAEKLLLNHVKAMRLKMLAEDIKYQTAKNNPNVEDVVLDQSDASRNNDAALESHSQEMIYEMLVASVMAEERRMLYGNASSSAAGSDVDNAPASAATTSQVTMRSKSSTEELKDQNGKNNSKGKEVMVDQSDVSRINGVALKGHSQEMIDEMLAASVWVEDCDGLDGNGSTSAAVGTDGHNASASATDFLAEYEDEESDEEMILPVSEGNVDPAVLAALPPSMQLDLLAQMRERLMAENRQKYQKVKKAPQKFSELQIESYLKTVAFRREINQVQRAASGRGMAGVQTSRIASEANREFIFSSSFSGDRQLLTSSEAEKNTEKLQKVELKDTSFDVMNAVASATKSNPETEQTANHIETVGDFVNDVQTFLDESGCLRVSRGRAMGIRMTRDLERNIDMLKEYELEKTAANNVETTRTKFDEIESILGKSLNESQSYEDINVFNGETLANAAGNLLLEAETLEKELSQKSKNCIKISFDDVRNKSLDRDDELFARLVAGEPVKSSSVGYATSDYLEVNSSLAENGNNIESDLEWEEDIICKASSFENQNEFENNISYAEGRNNDSDVEWEEGSSLITNDKKMEMEADDVEYHQGSEIGAKWLGGTTDFNKDASKSPANVLKTASKGSAEEEAALQEAIKRSLEDLTDVNDSEMFILEKSCDKCKIFQREGCSSDPSSILGSSSHSNKLCQSFGDIDGSNGEAERGTNALISSIMLSRAKATDGAVATPEPAVAPVTKDNSLIGNLVNNDCSLSTHIDGEIFTDSMQVAFKNVARSTKEGAFICNSIEVSGLAMGQSASVTEQRTFHTDVEKSTAEISTAPIGVQKSSSDVEIPMSKHDDSTSDFVGGSLEDELSVLSQEYKHLGDEQKKLERNADSVNNEMFVECQELLQMFGLPYIIAPMEAEAQCAYMEIMNLVDGVVTDDSDAFLFGARSVYKNIFDDRKYVETYFMKDIESELGLNREKLIRMALLLGSDYTEGVSGIGIVNAIEVVNAFPEEDGLHKFREWIESPDPTILGKVGVQPGSSSKKKRSKATKGDKSDSKSNLEGTSMSNCDALHENKENTITDDAENTKQIFMDKHRNVSKNWHISESFPSDAVINAYDYPQVDKSTDPFAWGKPDIFALRRLCWEKFAWASQKADELLQPVLKEYNKHETQLRLEAFYTFNERFAKIRSKRIKQAVKGITGKQSLDLTESDGLQKIPGAKGKVRSSTKKHTRKNSATECGNSVEPSSSETDERGLNDTGGSRIKGKQRQKSIRRGRKNPDSVDVETNSHNSGSSLDDYGSEVLAETVELPDSVRRSKRLRKAAIYVEKDEDGDELIPSVSNQKCKNEATERKPSLNQSVPKDDAPDFSTERKYPCRDPLPEDRLTGDYLIDGGGFCADEDQPEMANNEHLQSGGGFCIDENDADQDLQEQDGSTFAENTTNKIDELKEKDGNPSNVEDDAPSSAFAAIPYLKRKRRKT